MVHISNVTVSKVVRGALSGVGTLLIPASFAVYSYLFPKLDVYIHKFENFHPSANAKLEVPPTIEELLDFGFDGRATDGFRAREVQNPHRYTEMILEEVLKVDPQYTPERISQLSVHEFTELVCRIAVSRFEWNDKGPAKGILDDMDGNIAKVKLFSELAIHAGEEYGAISKEAGRDISEKLNDLSDVVSEVLRLYNTVRPEVEATSRLTYGDIEPHDVVFENGDGVVCRNYSFETWKFFATLRDANPNLRGAYFSCYTSRPRSEGYDGHLWNHVSTVSKGWFNNYRIDIAFVDPTWLEHGDSDLCAMDGDRMLHRDSTLPNQIEEFRAKMKMDLPGWRVTIYMEK